jgi:hypothetical protein
MAGYADPYGAHGSGNTNQKVLEMVEQGNLNMTIQFSIIFRQKDVASAPQ